MLFALFSKNIFLSYYKQKKTRTDRSLTTGQSAVSPADRSEDADRPQLDIIAKQQNTQI